MSQEESDGDTGSSSSADGPPIFSGQRISKGKRRDRASVVEDRDG